MDLLARLTAEGPKRILSLDGGGVRGSVTIGFLERLEQILRVQHGRPDLRLCDYFDLIGGTSAGSILASALAIGMEVEEVKQLAMTLATRIFGRKKFKAWEAFFDAEPLQDILRDVFGDRTLDSRDIRTGLCVLTKRVDTRSTWPLLNHPLGKYYELNRKMPLREAIYASTAAPYYFIPERIHVGDEEGAFVDGGVSMALNPSLQLFLLAILQGYPFQWQAGESNLLLVSVGTGTWIRKDPVDKVVKSRAWNWTREVPAMLMEDASMQNQLILQLLSRTQTPWKIDSEVGDVKNDMITPEPQLHYIRYNALIDEDGLEQVNMKNLIPRLASLREMSAAENKDMLLEIGQRFAALQVRPEHFPERFIRNQA